MKRAILIALAVVPLAVAGCGSSGEGNPAPVPTVSLDPTPPGNANSPPANTNAPPANATPPARNPQAAPGNTSQPPGGGTTTPPTGGENGGKIGNTGIECSDVCTPDQSACSCAQACAAYGALANAFGQAGLGKCTNEAKALFKCALDKVCANLGSFVGGQVDQGQIAALFEGCDLQGFAACVAGSVGAPD